MKPEQANKFPVFIDGEEFEAPKREMTANEILQLAGLDTKEHYLIQLEGKKKISYEDKGDEEIKLQKGAKFISVFIGPTPVADPSVTGVTLFAAQLKAMGYDVELLGTDHLIVDYVVDVGSYEGLGLKLGLVVPHDYPMTVPHGPHWNKQIHPCGRQGDHPHGGVHPSHPEHSQHFGDGWQHWSRPHQCWAKTSRDAVAYMAFIRGLWASQ